MKPKLILGLALVLSGVLFGCSTSKQLPVASDEHQQESGSNGLVGWISVPSLKLNQNKCLPAAMVLKNQSSKPIRICIAGYPIRSTAPNGERRIQFWVGHYSPTQLYGKDLYEELHKSMVVLRPEEILRLPFEIPVGPYPDEPFPRYIGPNGTIHLTGSFCCETNNVLESFKLNCWYGYFEVNPLTLKIEL